MGGGGAGRTHQPRVLQARWVGAYAGLLLGSLANAGVHLSGSVSSYQNAHNNRSCPLPFVASLVWWCPCANSPAKRASLVVHATPLPLPCRCSAASGPVAEQVLLLENISTSIQIGPEQLPSIHKLLVEAVSSQLSTAVLVEAMGITTEGRAGRCDCNLAPAALSCCEPATLHGPSSGPVRPRDIDTCVLASLLPLCVVFTWPCAGARAADGAPGAVRASGERRGLLACRRQLEGDACASQGRAGTPQGGEGASSRPKAAAGTHVIGDPPDFLMCVASWMIRVWQDPFQVPGVGLLHPLLPASRHPRRAVAPPEPLASLLLLLPSPPSPPPCVAPLHHRTLCPTRTRWPSPGASPSSSSTRRCWSCCHRQSCRCGAV